MGNALGNRSRASTVGASAAALFALAGFAIAGESRAAPRGDPLRELGRRLFFDPAASRMGMRSCADCHDPGHGYSDLEVLSRDDARTTKRHSQTIVDTADSPSGHWDGEFRRIEDVVRSRLALTITPGGETRYGPGSGGGGVGMVPVREGASEGPVAQGFDLRMHGGTGRARKPRAPDAGLAAATKAAADLSAAEEPAGDASVDVLPAVPRAADVFATPAARTGPMLEGFVAPRTAETRPDVESRIEESGRYDEAFRATFGDAEVTVDRIARAVERYCHSVRSGESAYDRYAAGKADALSPGAKRGLALFTGAAGCASCHLVDGPRAKFTDYAFHDTGVSWKALGTGPRRPAEAGDVGARQRGAGPLRAFKTPTLRDVARRGPFMHDGSLATLEDVVRHYVGRPADATRKAVPAGESDPAREGEPARDPALDPKFPTYVANDAQVADLAAFLRALTSDRRPGLAATAWPRRAATTSLTFVDVDGKPLVGFEAAVVPAGDVLPGFESGEATPRRLTTDAEGKVAFVPPHATHARVLLPDGLMPVEGDLVPDTCAQATVRVPVRGTARLVVTFPPGADAPDVIVVTHPDSPLFPGRKAPVSVLRRRAREAGANGAVQGTYETRFRTDVGAVSEIALEKPAWGLTSLRVFLDSGTDSLLTLP